MSVEVFDVEDVGDYKSPVNAFRLKVGTISGVNRSDFQSECI